LNREAKREATQPGRATNGNGKRVPPIQWRFGNRADQAEVSARGGVNSGISRRLAPLRQAETNIREGRGNGAANAFLLRRYDQREQDLRDRRAAKDEELRRANETLIRLLDEADDERERIASYKEEAERERELVVQLNAERRELDHRVVALRAAVQAGEVALVDRLRALDAAGDLDAVLEAVGVLERVEEVDDVAPSS